MKKLFFFSFAQFFLIGLIQAQVSAPKYSNEFLNIGIGARSLGMSNVQVASVNDVTAGYWNPSGLLGIKTKYEVGAMHAEYFAGISKFDYIGFATPIDSQSAIAVSVIRFATDNIPDTRFLYDRDGTLNYDNIKYFSAADYAFLISYARKSKMIKGLSLGANFKVIHRTVGNFANSWGFGLDAGLQYQRRGWMLGLMARDVTSTFNAWTINTKELKKEGVFEQTGNAIPENSIELTLPRIILGVAKYFPIGKKFGVLAAADFDNTTDGKRNVLIKTGVISLDPHFGIEANFKKIIYVRAGMGNIQKIKDFNDKSYTSVQGNLGVGFRINNKIYIDWALANIGGVSGSLYSNVISLKFALNK